KSSIRKKYSTCDIAFLNIYNKSEDEVLRLLISKNYLAWLVFSANTSRKMVQFVGMGAGILKDVSDILIPFLEQYALTHSGPYDHAWHESKKNKMESDMIETPS
ncbi:10036_t:CDS:2, partial [Cetraspora pellucida]